MEEARLFLKKEKCSFMASSVTYSGHVIGAEGLRPIAEKVDAIKEAPSPRKLTQLKSYLGLLTYYNHFLPNLSTVSTGYYERKPCSRGQPKKQQHPNHQKHY